MPIKHSRRTFLQGAAAMATVAPWVWVPRKAFAAATPAFGTARRVLVLYAGGGLRSAPLFNADASVRHNPFGQATEGVDPSVQWAVGSILGTQPVDLFGFGEQPVALPPVPAIAHDIAVLAGVDHEPAAAMPVIDHGTGDMALATGRTDGDTGILSLVHRDHPGYANGSFALPPFDLGLSSFGRGSGDYAAFRPIALQSAGEFAGVAPEIPEGGLWARGIREGRDARFVARRAPHVRPYLGAARDAKINARAYAQALRNPALDLTRRPEGTLGGVTNAQLLEVLQGFGGGPESARWGLEVGFALRVMQLGVPMVSVMRYLYDTHSDEKTLLPVDGGDLGRQIAGVHFLLKRMTDAEGRPMWNDTVVMVVSEFGRDNTDPQTGFNSAEGSDHQGTPASRNQCWALFGGPVSAAAGGRRIGGLDPESLETLDGPAIAVRSVWSTVFDLLGMDHSPYWAEGPVPGLFT